MFIQGQGSTAWTTGTGQWERLPRPCSSSFGGSMLGAAVPRPRHLCCGPAAAAFSAPPPQDVQPLPQTPCNTLTRALPPACSLPCPPV